MSEYSTTSKALVINQDPSRYGSFAEIGAGQEVARHFFLAGLASKTIAKTMSAYDMTFSDAIYGQEKHKRYVVESRLNKMLEREFDLLVDRLGKDRGESTAFFAFADTVATSKKPNSSHGWVGVRFQTEPGSEPNTISLHVWMKDRYRLEQQEALGVLGVNLIFSALYFHEDPKSIVRSLTENFKSERVDIDMIRFDGPAFKNVDNRLLTLELVRNKLTHLVFFDRNGDVQQPSDAFYKKSLLVFRGTFRPVTRVNLDILQKGMEHYCEDLEDKKSALPIMEINMNRLMTDGTLDDEDFLARVDTLNELGHCVLISDYIYYYELKAHLRRLMTHKVGFVIGASHIEKIFDKQYYEHLEGGLLEATGLLFSDSSKLYVYPYKDEKTCLTAETFYPEHSDRFLFRHLIENELIVDIHGCDDVESSIHSQNVRELMKAGDDKWKTLVPEEIVDMIAKRGLFKG